MKIYVGTTAALFALLTIAHVWRAVVEPASLDPWFALVTLLSAGLALWGARLWIRADSARGATMNP